MDEDLISHQIFFGGSISINQNITIKNSNLRINGSIIFENGATISITPVDSTIISTSVIIDPSSILEINLGNASFGQPLIKIDQCITFNGKLKINEFDEDINNNSI